MDPIEKCIQDMERQFINDDLKRRVVPMDLLPPEVQQAVIEEIHRKKLQA